MSRLGRISRMLIELAAISALAAGCTAVDEPGSRGPDRSSTTTTLPAEASAPISLSCGTGGAGGEVDTALSAPHQAAIDDALRAPEFHGLDISVSIWIDGHGEVVATLRSAPVSALVADMLTRSDNETDEALLREAGDGSTATGITAVDSVLQAVAAAPWGNELRAGLPVAGRTGTLAGRLGGQTTRGNVTAKTGSIIGGQALSGYATTAEGREMVFSIIVNGDAVSARAARPAIDALVTAAVGET